MYNKDFFPTPNKVIEKMVSYVDFKKVRTILEPSAGSGNIINFLKENKYLKSAKLDAIEKEYKLRNLLEANKVRVISDDFLSFETHMNYNLVIMNPPFSNGIKHLLKAISLQEQSGGQIVSLINTSIFNKDTLETKELLQKLDKYDAVIEDIGSVFEDAERKTSIDISIIYLYIKRKKKSLILDDLERAKTETDEVYNQSNLISSNAIDGLIQQYNFEVAAGKRLLREYQNLSNLMIKSLDSKFPSPIIDLKINTTEEGYLSSNALVREMRAKYWTHLFKTNKFEKLFTSESRSRYHEKIEELRDFEFNLKNIYMLQEKLMKGMNEDISNMIVDVFDKITAKYSYHKDYSGNIHLYNGWKTNQAYKIGKKVILPLNVFSWFDNRACLSGAISSNLLDLTKCLSFFDAVDINYDIESVIRDEFDKGNYSNIDTKYFNLRFYKKGTCHITFKDEDIIRRFNEHVGRTKNWLPPTYKEKDYKDLEKEEKEVVDSFIGEKEYEKTKKYDKILGRNQKLLVS